MSSISPSSPRPIIGWTNSGRYPGAQRLPSQRARVQQLGVRRLSSREALSMRQSQGLLATHSGKGLCMGDSPPPTTAKLNRTTVRTESHAERFSSTTKQRPLARTFTDIYQLRFALESFVCRLAAQTAQPDDIIRLRANVEHMQDCLQKGYFFRANRLDFDFHMHIIAMSGNREVADIFLNMSDVILESQFLPFYQHDGWQVTIAEHTAIIDALEHKISETAGQVAAQHIRNTAQRGGVYFPMGE